MLDKTFRDKLKNGQLGPEMVILPHGIFSMDGTGYQVPQFAIGKYPTTFAEYDLFCEVAGRNKPLDNNGWGRNNHPVICVSWQDAEDYCQWLSNQTSNFYRLPCEVEWEYACRAGTTTHFSFGDDSNTLSEYAWFKDNSAGKTHSVGEKKPNPWDLYDMHGNVFEWCADVWADKNLPSYKLQRDRVLRGGAWNAPAESCRSGGRFRNISGGIADTNGFRLVRVL